MQENQKIKHVAIIMDGNGRWAKLRKKLRLLGHKAGMKAVRESVKFAAETKLTALTLFAFSSENWQRPQEEVEGLMSLFIYALKKEAKLLHKNNVRLSIIGDVSLFPVALQAKIKKVEAQTQENTGLILNIAANYGGRWDITQACKAIAKKVSENELAFNEITEDQIQSEIQLNNLPDIDLLIRTGGEYRISNFFLWQIAYSELYFTPVLWPDFNRTCFEEAIEIFYNRTRRFGGL